MTSNALSTRRKFLRRPKVCKTLPNPGRCEPPPPPPPDWPADLILLHWIASWRGGSLDQEVPLLRVGEQWYWFNDRFTPPTGYRCSWSVDVETQTAELILLLHNKATIATCAKEDIPVTWNTETLYDITAWDVVIPSGMSSQAIFLF